MDTKDNEHLTRRAAILAVGGKNRVEIARELGITPGTVEILERSPLWLQLKEATQREVEERGVVSVVEELQSDTPRNLQFLRDIRDGSFADEPKRIDSRLRAAKMLLDKQVPNADIRAQNESAARIILDGKLLGQILHALRDVDVINITPREIEDATVETMHKVVVPKTPDEFSAEEAAALLKDSDD